MRLLFNIFALQVLTYWIIPQSLKESSMGLARTLNKVKKNFIDTLTALYDG